MAEKSKIEWTDSSWNPTTGCNQIFEGCRNCYSKRDWVRFSKNPKTIYFGRTFSDVQCHYDRLEIPLRWKKPRRIFVNSMSDLFHEKVDFEFLDYVFATILACAHFGMKHTFQILTKRPERMREYFMSRTPVEHLKAWAKAADGRIIMDNPDVFFSESMEGVTCHDWDEHGNNSSGSEYKPWGYISKLWPLPNVWIGVTVCTQADADSNIPVLLETPAAARFLSIEPMLQPIDLKLHLSGEVMPSDQQPFTERNDLLELVILGGETGPKARPMHPDWPRSIRDQCQQAGVGFFFKAWGEWAPCFAGDWHGLGLVGKPKQLAISPSGESCGGFLGQEYSDQKEKEGWRPIQRIGKKAAGRLLDGAIHD